MENSKVGHSRKQRLFIAIDVEPWLTQMHAIQKELQQQLHPLLHQITWYPVQSFHITLAFLGSFTPKVKQEIQQQVQHLLSINAIEPFELHAVKLSLLSGRHIIIEADGTLLEQLYEMLKEVVPGRERMDRERTFKPHIALGKLIKSRNINNTRHILTALELKEFQPIMINQFHLYESQPHRVYSKLESFSLEKGG
jgi:2'-5' RNA ligase